MSTRQKPPHVEAVHFVRHHLGKGCFAPLTGCDWSAWRAFVYLVECYSHGGAQHAISAMRETIRCAQANEDVLCTFVQTIPAVMDWGDVARIWPKIAEGLLAHSRSTSLTIDARLIGAVERCGVDRNGLGGTRTLHAWRASTPAPIEGAIS